VERTAKVAALSTRASLDLAVTRARQLRADEDERRALEDAFHLRTAEQALATMGEMKGALMKIGQMLSFVDTSLPPAYRAALANLQADAPPMAYELTAEAVRDSLGSPPDAVFAEFSREPIAAASIGQVHAARLPDGRAVAVKVQYPGVADAIRADLDNADMLFTILRALFPALDPEPIVTELRERIGEELDYRVELANQQRFLDVYRDHPFVHIPAVMPEYSTRTVLTMELVGGFRWDAAVAAPDELRQRWAEVIYRFVFGSLYHHRMFNGDPHPGNYRFHEDGSVTFLDFGCVRYFQPDDIDHIRRIVLSVVHNDAAELRANLVHFGFIPAHDDEDPERILAWFRNWYAPVIEPRVFTYTSDWAAESLRTNFDPLSEWGPVMRRFNMPREFVFLNRIQAGLNSILAGLGATNNWRGIAEDWWYPSPTP